MFIFLKMAWRDLWRHRLRSGLTVGAIMFGTAITLFFMAWLHGGHQDMIRTFMGLFPGYLQVHRAGYQMDQTIGRAMPLDQRLTEALDQSPQVKAYSPRLCTETLAQAGNNLSGAKICGVLPEHEVKTSRVAQTFFPAMNKIPKGIKTIRRYSGTFLASSDPKAVVIGQDLARNLQVEVGDELSVMTQDAFGSIAAANFKIRGIFRSGSLEYDSSLMMVNLAALQDLLGMSGQVTQLAVIARDSSEIPSIEKKIYASIADETGPWLIDDLGGGLWRIRPNKPNLGLDSFFQITDQEILERALGRIPGLKGYSMQVNQELWLHGKSVPVSGVVAEHEKTVQELFAKETGKFSGNEWVVLKQGIADKSGKKTGDPVIFTGANYLGENFEMRLKLAGTFESPAKPDAYVPLALLQEKLALGENVNQVLVKAYPRIPPEQARKEILSRLNYEVISWQELSPELDQNMALDNVSSVLFGAILFIIIAFVFLLTILMSVLERARQFGIMKAIGTKPGEVFRVIFYESVLLGMLGTAFGLLLGLIPSLYFTYIPLNLASFGKEMGEYMEQMGFEPYMYAKLTAPMFLYTALINFTFVLVMTIPPALRASRIKTVDTLRLQ